VRLERKKVTERRVSLGCLGKKRGLKEMAETCVCFVMGFVPH